MPALLCLLIFCSNGRVGRYTGRLPGIEHMYFIVNRHKAKPASHQS
jgi:hypothetical protein